MLQTSVAVFQHQLLNAGKLTKHLSCYFLRCRFFFFIFYICYILFWRHLLIFISFHFWMLYKERICIKVLVLYVVVAFTLLLFFFPDIHTELEPMCKTVYILVVCECVRARVRFTYTINRSAILYVNHLQEESTRITSSMLINFKTSKA